MLLNFFYSEVSKSVTKPYVGGNSGLHRWAAKTFVRNVVAQLVVPGIWMRRTSRSVVAGDICIEQLIEKETCLIRC